MTTPWARIAGKSLIAGRESASDGAAFRAFHPREGKDIDPPFTCAGPPDVAAACAAAWEAFPALSRASGTPESARAAAELRAALLDAAAANIVALGDTLIERASAETGLTAPRLISERDRTVAQLRMFAAVVREGSWVRASIDHGDAARRPIPKPDLRRMLRPLGPVAVFGASNFPLAYSVAGGDTASALAAGCPVIVKGHPAHPGTGELVARAVADAVARVGAPPGAFSFLHAGGPREIDVGRMLVANPCVRAVGFTGSFAGGTSVAALARDRAINGVPDPIPAFCEMGSTNPVFVLPAAASTQSDAIAERLAASISGSVGQMCTCPGLIFTTRGEGADRLAAAIAEGLAKAEPAPMLSPRVARGFADSAARIVACKGISVRAGKLPAFPPNAPLLAEPALFRCDLHAFRSQPALREECFGPAAIFVVADHEDDLAAAAAMIQGSLTASIFAAQHDGALALRLAAILEQRAGRIVFNGVPTGVEVVPSMVHGGPFPASNAPHTSAVGASAIDRWCRPVAWQNAPQGLLPPELRDGNPIGIRRTVNAEPETP